MEQIACVHLLAGKQWALLSATPHTKNVCVNTGMKNDVRGRKGIEHTCTLQLVRCMAEPCCNRAKEQGATRYLDINWRPVFWERATDGQGKEVSRA